MFIVEKKPNSIAAEAYRTLRTNIQYSSFDKEIKTMVVKESQLQQVIWLYPLPNQKKVLF